MERDEIIRLAREAELDWHAGFSVGDDEENRYERFAALVELRLNGRRGTPRPTDKGAIMIEQLNECRAEFEKWVDDGFADTLERDSDGDYVDRCVFLCWVGWQAAWNRCAVPEGWVTVPNDPTTGMLAQAYGTCGTDKRVNEVVYRAMLAAAPKPKDKP
jgi:hypothetical protein